MPLPLVTPSGGRTRRGVGENPPWFPLFSASPETWFMRYLLTCDCATPTGMNRSPSRKPAQIGRQASRICRTRLTVPNAIGLHARPAAMLTKTAQQYDAEITLKCGGRSVNAKSIMGILTLGAEQGTRVIVIAEGPDAVDAIRAIEALFACLFHEEPVAVEAAVGAADGPAVGSGEPPVVMPATLTPVAPA